MPRPTNAQLKTELATANNRISVALSLHTPTAALYGTGITCRICRDPYPCDTAVALGAS